ncbi:hypothetical protein [Bacillus sp. 3255]|uniref:hypothetical protein n=1 Tax=Bacillus sp. 3255 TaxID=2817904 RepID=UPI00286CE411|nr:hypothetical protein [Bacillus sp. 3255]
MSVGTAAAAKPGAGLRPGAGPPHANGHRSAYSANYRRIENLTDTGDAIWPFGARFCSKTGK